MDKIISCHLFTNRWTPHPGELPVMCSTSRTITYHTAYGVITNDVRDYINVLVRIAHIICNQSAKLRCVCKAGV